MAVVYKCPVCGKVWHVTDCFNYSRHCVVEVVCPLCERKMWEELKKIIEEISGGC